MSIDISKETLRSHAELARRVGKHVSTIHRWRLQGVAGIKLEAVRLGGTWFSSEEALQRFCQALTAKAEEAASRPQKPDSSRELEVEAAVARLDSRSRAQ